MKPTVENFEILGLFGGKDVKLSFTNNSMYLRIKT